jgi:hypothetical protein
LKASATKVYRRHVAATTAVRRAVLTGLLGALPVVVCAAQSGCTSVDPGPNFQVQFVVFDANYFYCHVEPGLIVAYNCGPGDPSKGDSGNGCHFNSSVVSGMPLIDHPAIDCGGGDVPLDPTQVATGSPAQNNLQTVSGEMSKDYTTAPIYTRPSSFNGQPPGAHPRAVFDQSDPTVIQLLSTWASKS